MKNGAEKNKFNKFDNRSIWIALVSLVLGYWIYLCESSIKYLYLPLSKTLIIFFLLFLLFYILNFVFEIRKNLQIQKLHNQPSWIFYAFWGGIFYGPIFASCLFFILHQFRHNHVSSLIILFNSLISVVGLYVWSNEEASDISLNPLRFAADSVGPKEDELDFKKSADAMAATMMKVDQNISVVFIYGDQGYGKSSYARMIIESENLPRNKILYTYISLTETNEAKDFSKLFAERWIETIKERYPKIDTSLALPFMQSILRESGNGIVAGLLSFIPGLSKGLLPTKAKFFDRWYTPRNRECEVSEKVANIFGNITEIQEELWIIMVDEIERALFEEVYRVVEIIERFKNEGRTGMPIKVMFLLCVSDEILKNSIETFEPKDHKAMLLNNFFFQNKSGTIPPRYIPPISEEKKLHLIGKLLRDFNNSYEQKPFTDPDLENLLADASRLRILDIGREYEQDRVKNLSYSLNLLIKKSPRFLQREIQGLRFSYNTYLNVNTEIGLPAVLYSFLDIEYARAEYPYLLNFFSKTIGEAQDAYNWDQRVDTVSPTVWKKTMTTHFDKNKKSITDWIFEVTGKKIPEEERSSIKDLVGSICYWYIDYYTKEEYMPDQKIKYFGTFNDPNTLYSYLTSIDSKGSTLQDLYNIYTEHKKRGYEVLEKMSLPAITEYSRFVMDLRSGVGLNIYVDVIKKMTQKITTEKINLQPKETADEMFQDVTYQLVFLIMRVVEGSMQISPDKPVVELKDAFSYLIQVLNSDNLSFGSKFTVLNSFANSTRGSGSEIHFRLTEAFKNLQKYWSVEINDIISKIFHAYIQKYYFGSGIIYEREINFFYTMYQPWSGDSKNTEEINLIRSVAKRGLEKYPRAIIRYWERYPYSKDWINLRYSQVQNRDPMSFDANHGNELYMPLETLIRITESVGPIDGLDNGKVAIWKHWLESGEYKPLELSNDLSTLCAVLISQKLYNLENLTMKNNVFIFHGTEGYPEENWFPWLKKELEKKNCKVFIPQFPSPPVVPSKISEWFEALKNYEQYINENTVLIGHSLGGVFTLRILEKLKNPVRAVFLVGTPIGIKPIANYDRDSSFSGFDFDWEKIKNNSKSFVIFHSDDDPYVSLDNGKQLAKKLGVNLTFIPNAGHFNAKAGYLSFPDLLEKIRKIL